MNLLHLSDLHFGTQDDAQTWAGQLADDLHGELNGKRLDALIVSGDVGTRSEPEEYAAAKAFLDAVCKEFGPGPEGIVLAPGNHDLNFPLAFEAYAITARKYYRGKGDLEKTADLGNGLVRVLEDDEAHRRRFRPFSDFYQAVTGKPYPLEYDRQWIIRDFPDANLLILSMNSCFAIDEYETKDAAIHNGALANALNEIRQNSKIYGNRFKMAVWHHPLDSESEDRIKDRGVMERLAAVGFSALLHGHVHKSEKNLYPYDAEGGRQIHIIGAGTFGAPSKDWWPGVPLQYHLLTLEGRRLAVRTRSRKEPNGAWEPACIYRQGPGKDSTSSYTVHLSAAPAALTEPEEPALAEAPFQIPLRYKDLILDHCRNMDFDQLRGTSDVANVTLPQIFIPLYAHPPGREAGGERMMLGERAADIEDLIAQHPTLVLKGQPGSGKSTLFKHVTYSMLKETDWKGLGGCIPILILLSRLSPFRSEFSDLPPNRSTAERLIKIYLETAENGLDMATAMRFFQQKNALLMLDGLDEIDPDLRELTVHSFSDFRHFYPGCRIVFAGRPHGIDDAVESRLGEWIVDIQSLTMAQVKLFIERWFCAVSSESEAACLKTAEGMLSAMRAHPDIDRLKDTPLMLTAKRGLLPNG